MSTMDKLASELKTLLTESDDRKPKPYDTDAKVVRVEDDILWVHIPGGVEETPIKKTINAAKGDNVKVHIANGTAWITGNETAPPTDDQTANVAIDKAQDALNYSGVAKAAADYAQEKATNAEESAAGAATSADQALESATLASNSAEEATRSASEASDSANSATYHLSEIEQVVGALDWISQHGVYVRVDESETTIIEGKWYFKPGDFKEGLPVENPKEEGFYEYVNDEFIFTNDETVISGKIYYLPKNYTVSSPTANPYDEGLYELSSVDSAVTNYISTHLYLSNDGLYVRMDEDEGAKLRITGTGIYLLNRMGDIIADYSDSIILGDADGAHIEMSSDYGLSFYQSRKEEDQSGAPVNRVAYIQSDRLFIQSATLTNNLQIGNFRWVVLDHRISLKYNPV